MQRLRRSDSINRQPSGSGTLSDVASAFGEAQRFGLMSFDRLKSELLRCEAPLREALDREKSLKLLCMAKESELVSLRRELKDKADDLGQLWGEASFQVADALNQPFPDRQFDLVWSMESGEHMPDKQKFVGELARVAAPGGTIILVTWCHRDLSPSEESLLPEEKELLNKICKSFYLPAWCSTADYVKLLQSKSLRDIKATDWSENVAPFWPAVIKSALTWRGFTSILRSGWKTIKAALAMPLMIEGYKKGLIKFVIITCRKPE
ncbi:gamma-tocopherol methyltransferase, chloroplastic-like [Nicotiana tabacum]|uniref:Gamma-tocopherol methyltransferase, chloroplastic-like n=1 Tax=Nicotiana tabacum TaxID=4097 RepID=A0AC58RV32_TOBAC